MTNISLYPHIKEARKSDDIPLDIFLTAIKDGKWQDQVLKIRTLKDPDQRKAAKEKLPYATICGKFSERKISGLVTHSGFICMDIDQVDEVEKVKKALRNDRYVYSCFVSVSGHGLALLFRINPEKHLEAFLGLEEYLYTKYGLSCDPSCKDVSRPRYVSYDPYLWVNEGADRFAKYPKKEKSITKIPEVVFVQTDFDAIVSEIVSRRLDITGNYHQWLKIGFALADKLGETGRSYFHAVSQFSSLYAQRPADRQYSNCCKAGKSGITIATFYYYAKQAGIEVMSEETRVVAQTAYLAKKGRRTKADTIKLLQDTEDLAPERTEDIVNQVFDNNIVVLTEDSWVQTIKLWLNQNHDIRRNVITRYLENRGKPMEMRDINTVYLQAVEVFEKLSFDRFERVLYSDFPPDYNPLIEYLEQNKDRRPEGCIRALFDTIESDTGMVGDEFFPDYKFHFGVRWLVGVISAVHGKHSPLMLVLSGRAQNTGKTEWWRRLLPTELSRYYAESKLDKEKDDEILMTQKLIIMDDEMGGKSKKESKRLKELTSKQVFSLREPYGRNNVDLVRLACLAGTSNDDELLNDPTGNRRIIPINVLGINHAAYNAIDKVDVLIEAYNLYKAGFDWQLTKRDIEILAQNTAGFKEISAEFELVNQFFSLPERQEPGGLGVEFLSTTQIKAIIENATRQHLTTNKLGQEMQRMGWERKLVKRNGQPVRGYYVIDKNRLPGGTVATVATQEPHLF
jgi:predicted P-loop ATPase